MYEYLFRDTPPTPIDVVNAEDHHIITSDGKKYLDFEMGWCVGNAGWNKKTIKQAIQSFSGPTYVRPTYKYKRWNELAKILVSLMPDKNNTCFRATGGTEAVELALKISRAYNKRKKFIAFYDAYHGQSFSCMGLVGLHEEKFGPYPKDYIRLKTKDWEETTELAVNAINKKDICAFIAEPIICNLGVIVPPKSFFEQVCNACKETDTLFIADEVATGFGRTGKMFAFEHFGIEPDIITIAKGFSSGYTPIAATIAKKNISESMRFDFSNYSTYGWHPLSVECAISNIEYLKKNNLVEKSKKSGNYLMQRLSEFCEPEGKGLCVGFDIKNQNIEQDCLNDGLIITTLYDRASLFPSLDIGEKEIDKAVDIIRNNF